MYLIFLFWKMKTFPCKYLQLMVRKHKTWNKNIIFQVSKDLVVSLLWDSVKGRSSHTSILWYTTLNKSPKLFAHLYWKNVKYKSDLRQSRIIFLQKVKTIQISVMTMKETRHALLTVQTDMCTCILEMKPLTSGRSKTSTLTRFKSLP